jgi:hypothetical protein
MRSVARPVADNNNRFDASGESDPSLKVDAKNTGQPKIAGREEGALKFGRRPMNGVRERARGPKFEEHYSQAQLFYNSLSPFEK